ncbi:hypothetical protein HDV00_012283 [Rhizophlyctis rosea]|nr:hypothetical protein HDV00_012283 [Rhizophlyctis rosea]
MAAVEFSSHLRPRLEQISSYVSNDQGTPSLTLEALLDTFLALYTDCKNASNQPEPLSGFLKKYDKVFGRLQNLRINTHDFEVMKTLATGAVGKVCLVRYKLDNKVYAMKVLKKTDLLTRREAGFFMEERDALVFAKSSDWITTLYAAFQDEEHLYLVMEYASGGSLRALCNSRETIMPEEEARFYIAEILLALEELHKHEFIHRDVKPENCLIDASGHVKLADFGSCIRIGQTRLVSSNETVGTPDYISPEILRAHEGNVNFGREVDWWSLGIIMYELLFDEVPFYAESMAETYGKIMDHEKHFAFPDDCEASEDAQDLMRRLICKKEDRLGRNGADEIKKHKWFDGFNWSNARKSPPPFVPELSGPDDTRYFEDEENEMKKVAKKALPKTREFAGQNLPFIGYTYIQNANAAVAWQTSSSAAIQAGRLTSGKNFASNSSLAQFASDDAMATTGRTSEVGGFAKLQAAQEEAKRLRTSLTSETAKLLEVQSKLGSLESDKAKLEADLKHLKARRDADAKERDELDGKVAEMKKALDREQREKGELRKAVEEAEKIKRELDDARLEAQRQSVGLRTREGDFAELVRAKEAVQAEAERLKSVAEEERSQRLTVTEQLKTVAQQLAQETTAKSELQTERAQQNQRADGLVKELDTARHTLQQQQSNLDRLTQVNLQFEKDQAVVQVELESAKREVAELRTKNDVLAGEVGTLRSQQQSASGAREAVEAIQRELEKASAAQQRLSEEIAVVRKARVLLDVELTDVKKQLQAEATAHNGLKAKWDSSEKRHSMQSQLIAVLQDNEKRLESLLASAESDLQTAKASLSVETQAHAETRKALGAAEQNRNSLVNDLKQSKLKIEQLHNAAQKQSTAMKKETERLQGELRSLEDAKQRYEGLYFGAQHEYEGLQVLYTRLQREQQAAQEDHDRTVSDLEAQNTSLKSTLLDNQKERLKLESDLSHLRESTAELESRLQASLETVTTLETDCSSLKVSYETACQRIEELTAAATQFDTRAQQLQDRIADLEAQNAGLREQAEQLQQHHMNDHDKRTKSMENVRPGDKAGGAEKASRTARLRNVFFKTSPTNVRSVSSQGMELITEGEDGEGRRERGTVVVEGGAHTRSSTSGSSTSMASSVSRIDLLAFIFDPSEGLRGYLKMPKDGKVKKGWKKVFAVVKEYKMFIYEKEKDADTMEGTMVVDIRCDFFVSRSVQQNELIHASGKDIDCIFKIQAAMVGVASTTGSIAASTTTTSSGNALPALQRKIAKLQNDIALEEKMMGAAERMWGVATEAQKGGITQQIQASQGRLRGLKAELERQNQALSGLQAEEGGGGGGGMVTPGTPSFTDETDAEDELSHAIRRLEVQLDEEQKKRDAVLRMEKTVDGGNGGNSPDKKVNRRSARESLAHELADTEFAHAEKNISKINDDLAILRSGNKDRIAALLKRIRESHEENEWFGHVLKLRQYYKPADCAVCHEALWGNKNQGLECGVCKLICHKACKALIDTTCQEMSALKTVPAKYFMAEDLKDRARWLAGLKHYRMEVERSGDKVAAPVVGVPVIGRSRSATLKGSPLKGEAGGLG